MYANLLNASIFYISHKQASIIILLIDFMILKIAKIAHFYQILVQNYAKFEYFCCFL